MIKIFGVFSTREVAMGICFTFIGIPVTFKVIYSKIEDHYFKKIFIDNIRLIVLEEGVVNDNQKSQLSYSNYKCY